MVTNADTVPPCTVHNIGPQILHSHQSMLLFILFQFDHVSWLSDVCQQSCWEWMSSAQFIDVWKFQACLLDFFQVHIISIYFSLIWPCFLHVGIVHLPKYVLFFIANSVIFISFRLLDIDKAQGFMCPTCGDNPDVVIMDGVCLGMQRTFMRTSRRTETAYIQLSGR